MRFEKQTSGNFVQVADDVENSLNWNETLVEQNNLILAELKKLVLK